MFTYVSGMEVAKALLECEPRETPTAIFASNDDMAAGIVALGMGIKVPMAHDLVKRTRSEGKAAVCHHRCNFELKVRGSTGPLAAKNKKVAKPQSR